MSNQGPNSDFTPIDPKPPFGQADADQFAQIKNIFKMIGLQIAHSIIANRPWKQSTKLICFCLVFLGNLRYNSNNFVKERPQTLYDALNVTRHATFDEYKDAKDRYLELLDTEERGFNQTKSDLIFKLETKLNNTMDLEESELRLAEVETIEASLNVT